METDASKRIWKFTKHKLTDKLLFLALAQHANGEGTCFPSYDTLASMVGVNRRSAIRIVEKLVKSGELFYKPTVGRGNTNLYFVVVGLGSGEVEQVLTTRYEMTADQAQTVIDSLLEKGVTHDIKSVTDDTISSDKTVLPITPLPIKGVIHNTRSKESLSLVSNPNKESKDKERESHAHKLKRIGEVDYLSQNEAFATKLTEICGNPHPRYVVNGDRKKLAEATAQLLDWKVTQDQLGDFISPYWWGDSPPRFDQVTKDWGRYLSSKQQPPKPRNGSHPANKSSPGKPPTIDQDLLERLQAGKE